jgi:hypothetical protein
MVETSMASRKLAAQSSSNASPAPLFDLETVIETFLFAAASSREVARTAGNEKMYIFLPHCKLIVAMPGITHDDE